MSYIPVNPNGAAEASASKPITLPAHHLIIAKLSATVNYEFLTNTTSGWFDAIGYSWISFTVVTDATVAAGAIVFESTNDKISTTNGVTIPMLESASPANGRLSSITLTAGITRQFDGPITGRYIRLRVTTTVTTGATVTVSATFQQSSPSSLSQIANTSLTALPTSSNIIGTVGFSPSASEIGGVTLGVYQSLDFSQSTVNTTTTTPSYIVDYGGSAAAFSILINTVTGTNPTLDIAVLDSPDNIFFRPLYHFERIVASGTYFSPVLRLEANYVKYVLTLGGTSPTFSTSIRRIRRSSQGTAMRHYCDRNLNPNTLNSTTAVYPAGGANLLHMAVASGAATSPATIALQASMDGTTWYTVNSANTVANTIRQVYQSSVGRWVRGIVTTAGTGQTLQHIVITTQGPS